MDLRIYIYVHYINFHRCKIWKISTFFKMKFNLCKQLYMRNIISNCHCWINFPQTSVDVPGSKREAGGNRRSASTDTERSRLPAPAPPLVRQADFDELEILGNSTVLDRQDIQPIWEGWNSARSQLWIALQWWLRLYRREATIARDRQSVAARVHYRDGRV